MVEEVVYISNGHLSIFTMPPKCKSMCLEVLNITVNYYRRGKVHNRYVSTGQTEAKGLFLHCVLKNFLKRLQ